MINHDVVHPCPPELRGGDGMLPLKEKDKPVVQKLLAAGCCARCVLRFCCVVVQALYRQPSQVGPRGPGSLSLGLLASQ